MFLKSEFCPVDDTLHSVYFPLMSRGAEIIFQVEPGAATGGYVARWDAPGGGGITTQGDSFAKVDGMIAEAVGGYFKPELRPQRVRCISPQPRG